MDLFNRDIQLFKRLQFLVQEEPWVVLIELTVFWLLVYGFVRFLKGTRGARAIKGVLLIVVIATLGIGVLTAQSNVEFQRLRFVYQNMLGFLLIALIIIFQPELRRGLVRLGSVWSIGSTGLRRTRLIEEVVNSVAYLSKSKIGALIVIEREVGLDGIIENAPRLDALVTHELLNTVFWPGSALHDMAVVIRGDRIVAAGVQLPLAEAEQFTSELGSRHRAAKGLALESDAMVVVVSEETGTISLAEGTSLSRGLRVDGLRTQLMRGLGEIEMPTDNEPATGNRR